MNKYTKYFITGFFFLITLNALADVRVLDNGTLIQDGAIEDNVVIGTETTGVKLIAGGGQNNVAIGDSALSEAVGGTSNIAIGDSSLSSLTSGNNNIAIGIGTLTNVGAGNNNIALGMNWSSANTVGILTIDSDNTSTGTTGTGSPLIYGDMRNDALTVNGTLNVTENTTLDDTTINGTFIANGAINLSGITTLDNTTINGVLIQDGVANFNDNVTIAGKTLFDGDIEVATGNSATFDSISAANGVSVGGTLSVLGDLSIGPGATLTYDVLNNLDNVTITGFLGVTDNVTFNDTLDVLGVAAFADNASVVGTLFVGDNATFADTVTISDNLTVAGTTSLDNTTIAGTLAVDNNTTIAGTLAVDNNTMIGGTLFVGDNTTFADTVTISDNLTVSGTSNLAGPLNVTNSLATLDNASIGYLSVTGLTNLTGDVAINGNLTLGTLTVTGVTSNLNTDNATIGTLYTNTIKSADGQMNLIRKKDDGTISIGQNSIDIDNTNDVISSSSGILTLGDHDNHVTKVRGILSIQDPTEPDHAATRRYVDQSAAMAAALDTRNPEKGKNFHMQLGGATKNQENALGLNFSGSMFLVNAPGANDALPFSISAGISNSANQYMGKLTVGLSW